MLKLINNSLLEQVSAAAKASPRLRMNCNFHQSMEEPIHKMLNAVEPGSYVRPHRHLNPDKPEVFLLLRGRCTLFVFDEQGEVERRIELNPLTGLYGVEIEPHVWHTLVVRESGTVLYEFKPGPYCDALPENFAPWSPEPNDVAGVTTFMELLK